ncbi:MAG: hypothetical protein WCK85_13135 [Chlorobium sp.]
MMEKVSASSLESEITQCYVFTEYLHQKKVMAEVTGKKYCGIDEAGSIFQASSDFLPILCQPMKALLARTTGCRGRIAGKVITMCIISRLPR